MSHVNRAAACCVPIIGGLIAGACLRGDERIGLEAPVGRRPDGSVVVPTNQILRPAGFQIEFPGRPVDLWPSPDGRTLVVKNLHDVTVIDLSERKVRQTIPLRETSFHGLAASDDGRRLYVSRSTEGIAVLESDASGQWSLARALTLTAARRDRDGPVPGGLALSAAGRQLLVALSRNNTLGIVDLATEAIEEIEVGIAPYGVVVAGAMAYVSNWAGRRPEPSDPTGPTSGSRMVIDPATFIGASGTVSVVDLAERTVVAQVEVGLHPSGLALNPAGTRLFVANANSDTVSVIDTEARRVIETISTRPETGSPFGSAPNALALDPSERRLYVANGSNNALAVVELGRDASPGRGRSGTSRVLGFVPTGWYPGAVRLDSTGRILYVANVKGVGSLDEARSPGGSNTHDHLGSVSIIPAPGGGGLGRMTREVQRNNGAIWSVAGLEARRSPSRRPVPVPLFEGERSVFKHVIYIIKENRTYDQVLGDLKKGNGDPNLCLFGEEVTPNHHALAEEFTLFDNFYCSGILSADGHHWATAAYATDYLEKSFGGWPRSYPYDGEDMLANSAGGFIWDKVLARGLTFRNYGEMVQAQIDPPGLTFLDIWRDYQEGTGRVRIRATTHLKTIEPYICPDYIGFPGIVSDQYRADVFLRELRRYETEGELPHFIVMLLPNDHTMGTRPGRPTPRATVADNDLALGRIVEAVTRSRFWPQTCIFVTEDDPQAGLDHVDGHRTIAYVISPYTRRGFIDSTNYNQTGMLRTMELILALTPMNQIDLTATPMVRCFQDEPDLSPYTARPHRIPLDEMNPELEALSGPARYWAEKSLAEELDEIDEADEDTLNRIIWHAVKGYDVPYPVRAGEAEGKY